jgi:hypothetical protein
MKFITNLNGLNVRVWALSWVTWVTKTSYQLTQ